MGINKHKFFLFILFSVPFFSYPMMKTGSQRDPGFTSSSKTEMEVTPTIAVKVPFLIGYEILPELARGQSGHWLAIVKKDDQYSVAIIRPYYKQQTSLLLNQNTLSQQLGLKLEILPQSPLLIDQGRYALIWAIQNKKEIPILFNLTKKDISGSLLKIPDSLPQNLHPEFIQGSYNHHFILASTKENEIYVIDARQKTLQFVPYKTTPQPIDALQVSPDGRFGVILTHEENSKDQLYKKIDFDKQELPKVSEEMILEDPESLGMIHNFQLFNNGTLVTHIAEKGLIGLFDPYKENPAYNFLRFDVPSSSQSKDKDPETVPFHAPVLFGERYIFTCMQKGFLLFLAIHDLQSGEKINTEMKELLDLRHLPGVPKDLSNTCLHLSHPLQYSDRHFSFMGRLIFGDSEIFNLSGKEQEKAIEKISPKFIFNLDIAGVCDTLIIPEALKLGINTSFDQHRFFALDGNTLLFTDPYDKEFTLYFHSIPTIRKSPCRIKNQIIPYQSYAINGVKTIGNLLVGPKNKQSKVGFQTKKADTLLFINPSSVQNKSDIDFSKLKEIYTIQGVSEYLTTSVGAALLENSKFPFPIVMTSDNSLVTYLSPCNSINNYGIARHTTDNANTVVGCHLDILTGSLKIYPAVWTWEKQEKKYLREVDKTSEGDFNSVDSTGTWTVGKHKINNEYHGIIKNLKTNKSIDLGPGEIFEMTWDASVLCGVKIYNKKTFGCIWKRTEDNIWKEQILDESEGINIDPNQIRLDRQNGNYVVFIKNESNEYLGNITTDQALDVNQLNLKIQQGQCFVYTQKPIKILGNFPYKEQELDISQLEFIYDSQVKQYKVYKKSKNTYFWSEKVGSKDFKEVLRDQSCYLMPDAENSRSNIIPPIESVQWCNGKDILVHSKNGKSYMIFLKDLCALCEIDN